MTHESRERMLVATVNALLIPTVLIASPFLLALAVAIGVRDKMRNVRHATRRPSHE